MSNWFFLNKKTRWKLDQWKLHKINCCTSSCLEVSAFTWPNLKAFIFWQSQLNSIPNQLNSSCHPLNFLPKAYTGYCPSCVENAFSLFWNEWRQWMNIWINGFFYYLHKSLHQSLFQFFHKIDIHKNTHFRVFILATVALIIVATVYENKLIERGYNLNGEKKCPTKDAERHEMNHINNNNNNNDNECEMYNKIHQQNDSQKLGEKQAFLLPLESSRKVFQQQDKLKKKFL